MTHYVVKGLDKDNIVYCTISGTSPDIMKSRFFSENEKITLLKYVDYVISNKFAFKIEPSSLKIISIEIQILETDLSDFEWESALNQYSLKKLNPIEQTAFDLDDRVLIEALKEGDVPSPLKLDEGNPDWIPKLKETDNDNDNYRHKILMEQLRRKNAKKSTTKNLMSGLDF